MTVPPDAPTPPPDSTSTPAGRSGQVRSRRRDVSRQRSTKRTPGQPPPGLDREAPPAAPSHKPSSVAARASRLARRTATHSPAAPANEPIDEPLLLDPTEKSAPAFAADADLTFLDLEPLRLALTHRSVLHDWAAAGLSAIHLGRPLLSNERLEFLGDAMLGAIVAEELYRTWPDSDEGTLTAQRVALVRSETLVRWARDLDLGDYIVLGNGERISDSPRDRILAGAFEALVGAISIDQGLDAARAFVGRFLRLEGETEDPTRPNDANPKGTLQEVVQDRFATQPVYETIGESGPDHDKVFTVAVLLRNERIGTGTGVSKRAAQQVAARMALDTLAARPADRGGSRAVIDPPEDPTPTTTDPSPPDAEAT